MIERSLALPCGQVLPNRLAKAAMSEQLADGAGHPTPELLALYRRWAGAGAGLLLTGNAAVDRGHPTEPFNVVVDADSDVDRLAEWAAVAKAHGSRVWLQLNHPGRQVLRRVARRALAPSRYRRRGVQLAFAPAVEMTAADIRRLVEAFARASCIAEAAGFDGVEIHAAHGYLLSQFLSPLANRRTDDWGGPIEGRMRFLVDTVRAVRATVSPTFAVGVKLNAADLEPGGLDSHDAAAVVHVLDGEGIDLLELTGGTAAAWLDVFAGRYDGRDGYFADAVRDLPVRPATPLMLTGGIRDAAAIERLLDGTVDLVGLARPFAVRPDVARELLDGESPDGLPRPKRSRSRALGAALHSPWYQHQLRRLAEGADPDPALSRLATARAYASTLRRWNRA